MILLRRTLPQEWPKVTGSPSSQFPPLRLTRLLWSFDSTLIQAYKIIKDRVLLMQATQHVENQERGCSFTKGMTLSQYMSQFQFQNFNSNGADSDEKQQNLFENQASSDSFRPRRSRQQFQIKQVEEESHEDSLDYQRDDFPKKFENEQLTKETFRETNYFDNSPVVNNTKPSMNATAYFNNSLEKTNFRVKHLSNSPYKKKTEHVTGGAITLYGRKFIKSIGKQSNKIPELATFYGKLKQKTEEKPLKGDHKRGGSKLNFKKKNQLELDDLIKFENKIKSNYSQKIYFQDIRIDGIKDKICERKNKLY